MTTTDTAPAQLLIVPVAMITAGDNDRTVFDPDALAELAASIDHNGLAQPPTVRPLEQGGYELVAGERRYRAVTELLGWTEVPVIVRCLSDAEAAAVMLAENVARADLNLMDEARAYERRIDRFGLTQAELAESIGVPRQTIYRRLRLLKLRPDIADMVARDQLGQEFAVFMADLDWDRQMLALKALNAGGLDLGAFRVLTDRLQAEQDQQVMFTPETFWAVEEYVADAKDRRKVPVKEQMRRMITRLAVTVQDVDPELAAEARKLVAA